MILGQSFDDLGLRRVKEPRHSEQKEKTIKKSATCTSIVARLFTRFPSRPDPTQPPIPHLFTRVGRPAQFLLPRDPGQLAPDAFIVHVFVRAMLHRFRSTFWDSQVYLQLRQCPHNGGCSTKARSSIF